MLPPALACEFPAQLSHRNAISKSVFALMRACFSYGVGSQQFSHILRILHHCHYDELYVQYLEGILTQPGQAEYGCFSKFADPTGYGGFVPSSSWLCSMYDGYMEAHAEEINQRCAMEPGRILALDHSFKVILFSSSSLIFLTTLLQDYQTDYEG